MSVNIITGYTGQRHITPYMDAAVNRGIFGSEDCILASGNRLSASMPSINQFVMQDGVISIQGHLAQVTGETLAVDTAPTGYRRIDLIVARFTHDVSTMIDAVEIVLVKGEETTSQYPTTPTVNTGSIASGATVVDMVLHKISLNGSDVTFSRVAPVMYTVLETSDWYTERVNDNLVGIKTNDSTSDTGFFAERSDTGVAVFSGVGVDGINHGVWSRKNNHWIIYEDNAGVCRLGSSDVRIGGHSSGIGYIADSYLTADKTCASGKWVSLCSLLLSAGTWVITCGARWNANANGIRQANISSTSGDNSQNISMMPAGTSLTSAKFSVCFVPTTSTRYYLNVYQNSGSNLVCPKSGNSYGNFIRAVRIK